MNNESTYRSSSKPHPWHTSYPSGITETIGKAEYENLSELFQAAAKRYTNKRAFICMGRTLTFDQVDRLSSAFAAYLQSVPGLIPGDRIAIQLPNILPYPVAVIGAIKAGLVVVNTNPLYTAREMLHQFADSEVKAIVILENLAYRLEEIHADTDIQHIIVVQVGDLLGPLRRLVVNLYFNKIKGQSPLYHLPQALQFCDVLDTGAGLPYVPVPTKPDDVALLQYTGGTTGVSKGAMLSHRNLIAHNQMVSLWFHPLLHKQQEDIMITPIPLYHIFGLTVNFILMYYSGVCNVLIPNPRDITKFIDELRKHKFTLITGVNTLYNGLLSDPRFARCDFSRLHVGVAGAMAVQDKVAKKWLEVTGKPLIEGYGLSETSPVICCNPLDGTHRDGTIGLPMPSTEVLIADDEGLPLPQGSTGEIIVRGPQVMCGYWRHEKTMGFFKDGWFRTGDLGVMDADGFFRIIDRKKDMIKTSGFNVYPNEIENVLASHPKVFEVAAVGFPDEKSGEVIKVFIVKRDPALTESDVIDYCRKHLTAYKVPRHIEFRDTLPKSNVGKILRRMLKEF